MYKQKPLFNNQPLPVPQTELNMSIAELDYQNTDPGLVDMNLTSSGNLEPSEPDLAEVEAEAESIELEDESELVEVRTSGYQKTIADDAVGAFFKEMARYPLLKPSEEIELARRIQVLVKLDEHQKRLQTALRRHPTTVELAAACGLTERQLENRLYQGRVAKRPAARLRSAASQCGHKRSAAL